MMCKAEILAIVRGPDDRRRYLFSIVAFAIACWLLHSSPLIAQSPAIVGEESTRNLAILPLEGRQKNLLAGGTAEANEIAATWLAKAEQHRDAGRLPAAYRSLWFAWAQQPDLLEIQKLLRDDLEGWGVRKVQSRSNLPQPSLQWPAGSYTRIETPHFDILSQAPSQVSGQIAEAAEETLLLWKQIYPEAWLTLEALKNRWQNEGAARNANPARNPMRVVICRDAASYQKLLAQIDPRVSLSTGYYHPGSRQTILFWSPPESLATLRHELTHQFFQEAGHWNIRFDPNESPGVWAIEGAAMFLESATPRSKGRSRVVECGGWDADRLQPARYRRFLGKLWIPIDQLHQATGKTLQGMEDLPAWYSHSAGLSQWMLEASPESSSDWIDYLRSVYEADQPDPEELRPQGKQPGSLEAAYDRFLEVSAEQVAGRLGGSGRRSVVLSLQSDVTSSLFSGWSEEARDLQWLDLSGTQVDDTLFATSGASWSVERLGLERTKVGDLGLQAIAKIHRLRELDLSHCSITDQGVASFAGHMRLETLWLTDCPITDDAVESLVRLPKLKEIHLEGTRVSDEARDRLMELLARRKRR
ncbi:MAG: leucine-rich repeat domain-containing protein [Pirellulaceae bacterium]